MRFLLLAVTAALSLAISARASDLELTHARIYTAPFAPSILDGAILLHNDKIAAVGPTASIKVPPATQTIDCTGLTIVAGFWNSHVHILPPTLLHAAKSTPAALSAQLETMFTRYGFTTLFDIGSVLASTNYLRDQIASGIVVGPRILTTGEPFFGPNGTPIYIKQYLIDQHVAMPEVTSVPQAVARVDSEIHDGADAIKIFAGSIESDGVLLLPADLARAIVAEAHKQGKLVFSHPSSIRGVELSLASGVDILAHVSNLEGPWPPALIARMKAAHLGLIPTLTLFDSEMQKAGASPEDTQKLIALAVSQVHEYASAGGQILFGTDVGYTDRYDTIEEVQLMSRAGMTFPQILASMTTTPAERFGFSTRSGRILPGFDADLTVLKSDPAADIAALSRVAYTIRSGKILFHDVQDR